MFCEPYCGANVKILRIQKVTSFFYCTLGITITMGFPYIMKLVKFYLFLGKLSGTKIFGYEFFLIKTAFLFTKCLLHTDRSKWAFTDVL